MPADVFVLGLDELNRKSLEALPRADRYRFHGLLTIEELQQGDEIPFEKLLDEATRELEAFQGEPAAVVGYWDFPVTSMIPILAERFGLPSTTLESVVRCEHKYWARLTQREVLDEVPRFAAVDPFADDAADRIELSYPYWIKPIKGFSSELAFRIDGPDDLAPTLTTIRRRVGRVADPFRSVLDRVDLPDEIARLGTSTCIAEEAISGHQATLEGWSDADGQVHTYGVVDSISLADAPSFDRFQFPSIIPEEVCHRMVDVAERIIGCVGLVRSTFNIEFFWNPDTDALNVLELNPRHSQSHAKLFEFVDGWSNHRFMVEVPFGRVSDPPEGRGRFAMAAKCFLRRFDDAHVTHVPTRDAIAAVEREVPGAVVQVVAKEGLRLSDLYDQDSYSYKYANVYVGGDSEQEVLDKRAACEKLLPFEFEEA